MTQQTQNKKPETSNSNPGRLAHWGRVAVMLLSFGIIYPNAMIEDMDLTKYDADNEAKSKTN